MEVIRVANFEAITRQWRCRWCGHIVYVDPGPPIACAACGAGMTSQTSIWPSGPYEYDSTAGDGCDAR